MKVKFISNIEPCIQYEVKNSNSVLQYSDILGKYCECIDIEVLGLVPKELLTETDCDDNINAIDIVVYLTNNNLI